MELLASLLASDPELLNFRDYDARSALHLAVAELQVDAVRWLLQKARGWCLKKIVLSPHPTEHERWGVVARRRVLICPPPPGPCVRARM